MMELWKQRVIEYAVSITLAASLVAFALFLGGCAQMQKERQRYFEPEQLPASKGVFQKAYSDALKAAQDEATPERIKEYIDAGSTLLATSCHSWIQLNTLANRGILVDSGNLALLNAASTTLAGALGASGGWVTGLGVAQAGLAGYNANLQQHVLGVPAEYSAQTAVLAMQANCTDTLMARAPATFSAAYRGLLMCERLCSQGAAADATTRALQGVVRP